MRRSDLISRRISARPGPHWHLLGMNTALVTGGAGFIGSHLVERLLALGWNVRVLDNFSSGRRSNLPEDPNLQVITGDLADAAICHSACRRVDVVFHMAGIASVSASIADPNGTHATNLTGTLRILSAARQQRVRRVVYSSSASVYGSTASTPTREDQCLAPESFYASQKAAGELYCRNFWELYCLETVTLRYFNVFGPRQNANSGYAAVIPLFVQASANDQAAVIYGDGQQTRDFIFVENVVEANICALQSGTPGESYNVASGCGTTVLELLDIIDDLQGRHTRREFASPRPGEIRHSRADIDKARLDLGFIPAVGLEQGLRRTLGAMRSPVVVRELQTARTG